MSAVEEAASALEMALKAVTGLRVYTEPGAVVDPPAVVLGPPQLSWEAYTTDPTTARFLVMVVVPANERAMASLWALVPQVAAAAEQLGDAALSGPANPGTWTAGGQQLPCYELPIGVSL